MSLTAALPKTGAPRRKKAKSKKKKVQTTATIHVVQEPEPEVEPDLEQDVEPLPVAGLAFAEADAEPEVEAEQVEESSLTGPQLRQQRSLAKRRLDQAKELGYAPDDARFVAAKTDGATFTYTRALTAGQRVLVTAKEIGNRTMISQDEWDERRRARVDLLTDDDKLVVAARWGMDPKHSNVARALTSQADWTFALTLTADEMTFISGAKWKKRTAPSADEIAALKKARLEEEAKAKALQEKKDRDEAAAKKRAEGEATWKQHRETVMANLKARLATEAPGLAPETIQKLLDETGDKIAGNKTINVDNQIKLVDKSINAEIVKSKKRTDIEQLKAPYKWLKGNILRDLINTIVDDPTKVVADFTTAADQARVDQRNLLHLGVDSRKSEWARLLGLKFYKAGADTPFERLADRVGLQTHYSVDASGFNAVTALTSTSTAAQLLDAVFCLADPNLRHKRLHVSLETGTKNNKGELALPHRYWGLTASAYDYTCDNGTHNRWFGGPDGHTKAEVKQGLDDAYQELSARLLLRAQKALDQDCNV